MDLNFLWEEMKVFNNNLSQCLPVGTLLLCGWSDQFPGAGLKHSTCLLDIFRSFTTFLTIDVVNTVITNTTRSPELANQILVSQLTWAGCLQIKLGRKRDLSHSWVVIARLVCLHKHYTLIHAIP
ncbi:hypothetical protein TNCV_48451 [Trichonephila clavipes]|nr:hypothetical protein TNCV_48451 [Trichonephila clavipes]